MNLNSQETSAIRQHYVTAARWEVDHNFVSKFEQTFDEWFAPYEEAFATLQRIRDEHKPIHFGSRIVCAHCTQRDYPCPVIKALESK
jgi:hypothetical protein